MDLPKYVIVFGQKFKIKAANLGDVMGLCDRSTNTIYLSKALEPSDVMPTLLHEIGHAVFSRVSLVQAVGADIEEVIVDTLANTIIENFDVIPKGLILPKKEK